jgi:DNA helicase-2/ATP-dependent DNA helicase PcrA
VEVELDLNPGATGRKAAREADANAGGLDRRRRQYIPVVALLAWTTETAAAPGRAAALSYRDARRRYVAPARAIGADRRSLDSSAAQLFDQFRPGQSAAGEHGSWIEPPLAQAMISALKLEAMVSPDEYAELADPDNDEQQTLLHLYRLYEQHLAEQGRNDFDDLLRWTVRALRTEPEIRDRWQRKYTQVLVDEYRDIGPAQETLVQILAAPHDGLFCVGDEDQTLYGWRRASVERIIQLDHRYPGLQRVALSRNYRCPTPLVDLSRRVIEHNRARFPKPIQSVNVRELPDDDRPVIQLTYPALEQAAADVARKLSHGWRGGLVCLARTTRLLPLPLPWGSDALAQRRDSVQKQLRSNGARRGVLAG